LLEPLAWLERAKRARPSSGSAFPSSYAGNFKSSALVTAIDSADAVRECAAKFGKQDFKVCLATFHYGGRACETKALAHEDIDEVDLDARVRSEVSNRARRAYFSECNRPVVYRPSAFAV
jgi:hypothetical protein